MTDPTNYNHNDNDNNDDSFIPKAVTDFIFDLYDSVTLSQIHTEQNKLYQTTFVELCHTYYPTSAWPSPASIASECHGDPLFLAMYRELIHRYYFNNTNLPNHARPTLTDRMEGWDVYKDLFDEILELYESRTSTTGSSSTTTTDYFYLVPTWVFELLFEFIYQFQGYCQIKSAVYATAKKNHLIDEFGNRIVSTTVVTSVSTSTGTTTEPPTTNNHSKHVNLLENLSILEQNTDAWDVSVVFHYLHRFLQVAGLAKVLPSSTGTASNSNIPVVYSYFGIFSSICQSRLECLLGDYTGCLLALDPLEHATIATKRIIQKDDESYTIHDIINSVTAARVSLAYHAGISYLQLRRYYDTYTILMNCTTLLQRGFKTGTIRTDLFNKQYERMLSLLIIVLQLCPGITQQQQSQGNTSSSTTTTTDQGNVQQYDESMIRTLREKHSSSKIETITATVSSGSGSSSGANNNNSSSGNNNNNNNNNSNTTATTTNYDEWFASPKFITSHPIMMGGSLFHRQQIDLFHQMNMKFFIAHGTTLRSFLKLYTSIPLDKLASFHDIPSVQDFLPILLTYKARIQYQIQRVRTTTTTNSSDDTPSSSFSLYSSGVRSVGNINNNTIQDDMHYYIQNDAVNINEAAEQRHLESYLCTQMRQLHQLHDTILKLDTNI